MALSEPLIYISVMDILFLQTIPVLELYIQDHLFCDIFYASSKWKDVNSRSWDTTVSLQGHSRNGMVGLVYRLNCDIFNIRFTLTVVMKLLYILIFIFINFCMYNWHKPFNVLLSILGIQLVTVFLAEFLLESVIVSKEKFPISNP